MSAAADNGYENPEKRALLATHIDPAWEGPSQFQINVEQYIEEEEYDDFVCISSNEYAAGDFDDRADHVIRSQDGYLSGGKVEELLDEYDEFLHIGAYWGRCHANTFIDLVKQIGDRPGSEYRFDVPLDGVTSRDSLVSDVVLGQESLFTRLYQDVKEVVLGPQPAPELSLVDVYERLDDSEMSWQHNRYVELLEPWADQDSVDIAFAQEELLLSYTFTPKPGGDNHVTDI